MKTVESYRKDIRQMRENANVLESIVNFISNNIKYDRMPDLIVEKSEHPFVVYQNCSLAQAKKIARQHLSAQAETLRPIKHGNRVIDVASGITVSIEFNHGQFDSIKVMIAFASFDVWMKLCEIPEQLDGLSSVGYDHTAGRTSRLYYCSGPAQEELAHKLLVE